MNQLSIADIQSEASIIDDFRWLQQLQGQIDEVQEQIDVTAIAKDKLPKSSRNYRTLQKHLNAEIKRRAKLMQIHEAVAKSRGYQLHVFPRVFEGGDRLQYVYFLTGNRERARGNSEGIGGGFKPSQMQAALRQGLVSQGLGKLLPETNHSVPPFPVPYSLFPFLVK